MSESEQAWLGEQERALLEFARASIHPEGGFAWLDDHGRALLERPVELLVTTRMTHCFALAQLRGDDDAARLVEHGLAALTGRLRDPVHGGWFASVGPDGPVDPAKQSYQHAFVVLAASSALLAGHDDAADLLEEALGVLTTRFWSPGPGRVVDTWDRSFTTLEPYRGLNATMHWVEALLAAHDATGDPRWRDDALGLVRWVVEDLGPSGDWRLCEHFDEQWRPLPEHHRDRPADPFRPYGATVGHGLEWSRLALATASTLDAPPASLRTGAVRLYDRAVRDGWAVDGADGFVYTTDWAGHPVVHERMHWVAAEAVAAASVLGSVTGDPGYAADTARWWAHLRAVFVDPEHGSWRHELDRTNRPSATVWVGKPDIYHAYQAVLVPQVPLAGSIAAGVRAAGARPAVARPAGVRPAQG